jgi:very-short-patch-repair endonuclease
MLSLVLALKTRLPAGAAFSHATAATLLGLPLPPRFRDELHIHVAVPAPTRAPRIRRVVGHQLTLDAADIASVDGIPVTGPCRTWADFAPLLDVAELVALGDAIVDHRSPLGSIADVQRAVAALAGRGGAKTARDAAGLIHDRSESPQESMLRVALVRAGLPRLEVNESLYDAHGAFLARPDLRFPDFRTIVEYEGDHHRTDRRQWRRDLTRTAKLQQHGETVIRLGVDDLPSAVDLVSRLLRRAGWAPDAGSGRSPSARAAAGVSRLPLRPSPGRSPKQSPGRAVEHSRGSTSPPGKSYQGMKKLHGLQ